MSQEPRESPRAQIRKEHSTLRDWTGIPGGGAQRGN